MKTGIATVELIHIFYHYFFKIYFFFRKMIMVASKIIENQVINW